MDQGIAGLAGAAIGGLIGVVGTLGAARHTSKELRRSQHEHWRRQVRRDAYSAFLTQAQVVIDTGNRAGETMPRVAIEHVSAMQQEQDRLWSLRNTVLLEGPPDVVRGADHVYEILADWTAALRTLAAAPEDPPRDARSRAAWAGAEVEDALESLGVTCRQLLDTASPEVGG
ncbi:hypothetical protein [Streptomyces sp. CC219B]|uniref:hypothetical protein n=1 Tax=Streptomyces sp. CC219B TaxID=3044574 RepID=UPI0024A8B167|nr:hypothetical protein [Streptomyces sp. CC219B]